jgi:fructuronate reductase
LVTINGATIVPLDSSTASGVANLARLPSYDPRETSTGILHIGLGGFHRAHQAAYVDDVLGDDPGWGICAVAPRDPGIARALRRQDGLYTLWSRGEEEPLRIIGSIRETLCAAEDPDAVVRRLADPAVRLVTLTVTEKAYRADPTTRRLRADEELRADAAGREPRTVVGLLARGLQARSRDDAPLTVMSCDNFTGNGRLLRTLLEDYCTLLPTGAPLADWMSERVTFPSTMVDRIVPAISATEQGEVANRLGLRDDAAVVAEPFGQWIIEDQFAAGRPAWPAPDVRVVADAEPYERLKLRVVNAAHSMLAYLGLLSGYVDVSSAVEDPVLAEAISRLLDEDVLPTLADVPSGAVAAYRDSVLERFANPAIRYPLRQVGADGSQKLPQRLVPMAVERSRRGERSPWVALGVASWMLWVHRCATETANRLDDPAADDLLARATAVTGPTSLAAELLSVEDVFGSELPQHELFRNDVESWARQLWRTRPAEAIKASTDA